MSWVSTTKKSEFLKWFLNHHQLKNKEARRIIDYIQKNHHILRSLSFTETIQLKERTIIISSINSDKTGFLFYDNNNQTEEVSEAFWSLMDNPAKKTYIILHFFGKQSNFLYTELIEPSRLQSIRRYEQSEKDAKATNLVVEIALLKSQINKALDDRNEEVFKSLTEKLKELQKL
ncbi:YpiB family protein [Metabacillus sediminilitoris]|uniref:IDEAL domain-containing protein n=1 Tax=Metabacillus sediminilitoris TaxID=2567941 RepID=A0A4S4BIW4_9BACI|nr:YpiB family protein [Metabacillus sediminilitoris]QGQ48717.1 IDEAL domain-containing protein [Metabacillus sediminilitoris]THF74454.1 IDEAL domain-containing protein [Metabacillus sediminilitoris]